MMLSQSHFAVLSFSDLDTTRIEGALGQFRADFERVNVGTLGGELLWREAANALFHGERSYLPVLAVVSDDVVVKNEKRVIWEGGNPSELEILQAVYLAGDFA